MEARFASRSMEKLVSILHGPVYSCVSAGCGQCLVRACHLTRTLGHADVLRKEAAQINRMQAISIYKY